MAANNPLMPPGGSGPPRGMPTAGANPGAAVPQPGMVRPGGVPGPLGGNRIPGPGVRGAGASIVAPAPPDQPPSGMSSPGGNVPPSKQGQPFADIYQNFNQAKAAYQQTIKARETLDHIRTEFDQLMEKGDIVRPEDVIESAGRLVGHGFSAAQIAQVMSDMPAQGGEALASWIRMHDVTLTNAEQGLIHETSVMRNRMGVAAIRGMGAMHMEQGMEKIAHDRAAAMGISPGGMPPMGAGGGNALMGDQSASAGGSEAPMDGQITGGPGNV